MSRDYDSRISGATKFLQSHEVCRQLINNGRAAGFAMPKDPKDGAVFASSLAVRNTATRETVQSSAGSFECFAKDEKEIDGDAIFNIGSISKPFAAATLLRMAESDIVEEYGKYFPYGLETKVSFFLDYLKERYPDSDYIQTELETEPNFANISLLNLLNHTSGLGNFDSEDFAKLRFESPESLSEDPDGKLFSLKRKEPRPAFGEFSYSDLGYELLGMIIAAVGTIENGAKRTYGDMLMENVIEPLELSNTFAPDVIGEEDGKIVPLGMGDEKYIVQAQDFNPATKKLTPARGFRRTCGAPTAVYSTPTDVCKFFQHFLTNRSFIEMDLMRAPNTVETSIPGEHYGIGHFVYREPGQSPKFFHGASTIGFFGHVRFDPEKRKVACCLNATQNATTQFLEAEDKAALKSKIVCERTAYSAETIEEEATGILLVKASNHPPKPLIQVINGKEFEEKARRDGRV